MSAEGRLERGPAYDAAAELSPIAPTGPPTVTMACGAVRSRPPSPAGLKLAWQADAGRQAEQRRRGRRQGLSWPPWTPTRCTRWIRHGKLGVELHGGRPRRFAAHRLWRPRAVRIGRRLGLLPAGRAMAGWPGGSGPRRRIAAWWPASNWSRRGPSPAACWCRATPCAAWPGVRRFSTAGCGWCGSVRPRRKLLSETLIDDRDPETGKELQSQDPWAGHAGGPARHPFLRRPIHLHAFPGVRLAGRPPRQDREGPRRRAAK